MLKQEQTSFIEKYEYEQEVSVRCSCLYADIFVQYAVRVLPHFGIRVALTHYSMHYVVLYEHAY